MARVSPIPFEDMDEEMLAIVRTSDEAAGDRNGFSRRRTPLRSLSRSSVSITITLWPTARGSASS